MSIVLPGKTIYVSFGRFQPPTKGHLDNFNGLSRAAGNNDYRIYLSQTQDSKGDNPLAPESKKEYIKKMMSTHADKIYSGSQWNVIAKCLQHCMVDGYNHLVFMVGSDRVNDMQWVKRSNGKTAKDGTRYYFTTVEVKSTGERDADGHDKKDKKATGGFAISGTKLRVYASLGDEKSFKKGMPSGMNAKLATELYDEVRKNLPAGYAGK